MNSFFKTTEQYEQARAQAESQEDQLHSALRDLVRRTPDNLRMDLLNAIMSLKQRPELHMVSLLAHQGLADLCEELGSPISEQPPKNLHILVSYLLVLSHDYQREVSIVYALANTPMTCPMGATLRVMGRLAHWTLMRFKLETEQDWIAEQGLENLVLNPEDEL